MNTVTSENFGDTPVKPTSGEILKGVEDIAKGLDQSGADLDALIAESEAAIKDYNEASNAVDLAAETAMRDPGYTGPKYQTAYSNQALATDQEQNNRVSAYNLLLSEFTKYGLGSLVSDAKDLLLNRTPAAEIPLALQNTEAYQKRFSANQERIKNGLRALSPAEYISKEDAYQTVMRNYGLPASYYQQNVDPITGIKKQDGFDKLIAGDVDDTELENRLIAGQQKLLKGGQDTLIAFKQFFPEISQGDLLAYVLDPKNALKDIQRKVATAEIGGAALSQGLQAGENYADTLAGLGVTKAQALQNYQTVAELAPRGSQLSSIYGESPYGQSQAEAEVFNTEGGAEAARRRKKLTDLEKAQFSGSSGVGALSRDRANNYGTTQTGYGAY